MLKEKFKEFYAFFKDEDAYNAQDSLNGLKGTIQGNFLLLEETINVEEIPQKNLNDKGRDMMSFFEGLTVTETITMIDRLFNAINHERNMKVIDLKVSDLPIVLL